MKENIRLDIAFGNGELFRRGEIILKIVEKNGEDYVLARDDISEKRRMSVNAFHSDYVKGLFLPLPVQDVLTSEALQDIADKESTLLETNGGVTALSQAAIETGSLYIYYIKELHRRGYNPINKYDDLAKLELRKIAREKGDVKPPALSTLYTCDLKIRQAGGDLKVAFPNYADRGGKGGSRIRPEAKRILTETLEELALNGTRIRTKRVFDDVRRRIIAKYDFELGMEMAPSDSTVKREIFEFFGAHEICRRNEGEKAANAKFRNTYPRDRAIEVNEVVECDDKDTRIFLIDERTGLPYGRGWVTVAIDQFSDVPGGICLGNEPRSTRSALMSLVNYVLPKDVSAAHMKEVKSTLPYMGRAGLVIMDNALQNHSATVEAAVVEIGNAIIEYAKPYTPTEKSTVEGVNAKMARDFLEWLPGYVKAKRSPHLIQEGICTANLTVAQFRLLFHKWVYDVFCKKVGIDGYTPEQRWRKGMEGRLTRVPCNVHNVMMAAMLPAKQQIHADGIRFKGIPYQHSHLQEMRKNHGDKFQAIFRYDPDNLGHIWVMRPDTKSWFMVASAMPDYTRELTEYQHGLIQKLISEKKLKNPSKKDYLEGFEMLVRLVDQLSNSKKMLQRRKGARIGNISSKLPVTELQSKVEEIDEQPNEVELFMEMELGDKGWNKEQLSFQA